MGLGEFSEVMQILDEGGRTLGSYTNSRLRLGLARLSQIVPTPSRVNIRLYANAEKNFLLLHCSGFLSNILMMSFGVMLMAIGLNVR